jgi:hypothetical protein
MPKALLCGYRSWRQSANELEPERGCPGSEQTAGGEGKGQTMRQRNLVPAAQRGVVQRLDSRSPMYCQFRVKADDVEISDKSAAAPVAPDMWRD